jgi:hypothetical protein
MGKPNNVGRELANNLFMRILSACFCLLAVTACSGSTPASPTHFSRDLVLSPGQTVPVAEAGISLRFDGVSGDSRCPLDAICIQGGDALVKIAVLPSRGSGRDYALHTADLRPVGHDDLTIALLELSPYPFSSRTIAPEDYRATVRITR